MIVAYDLNRCIGANNTIPWHLPEDMKFFKEMTVGKTVIMGRKTYESIGRPLPNRRNLVVSKTMVPSPGIDVYNSLANCLAFGLLDTEEAWIIGGAQIYEQALNFNCIDNLYITEIFKTVNGDTYFPMLNPRVVWNTIMMGRFDNYHRFRLERVSSV